MALEPRNSTTPNKALTVSAAPEILEAAIHTTREQHESRYAG
jgi:hypothetical protein